MDTNENTRTNVAEDLIVLGVASVETKGGILPGEMVGAPAPEGIAEE